MDLKIDPRADVAAIGVIGVRERFKFRNSALEINLCGFGFQL